MHSIRAWSFRIFVIEIQNLVVVQIVFMKINQSETNDMKINNNSNIKYFEFLIVNKLYNLQQMKSTLKCTSICK